MKFAWVILLAGVNLSLQAQPGFPDSISTSKTSKHQSLKGTSVFAIIPDDFTLNESPIPTYVTRTGAGFMALELPAAIDEITVEFTKEGIAKRGMKLLSKKPVMVNGMKGLYLTCTQTAQEMEFQENILLFGDNDRTFQVVATYCKELEDKSEVLKEMLLSVYTSAETKKVTSTSNGLPYTMDMANSNLKFAKAARNGLMTAYTSDGKYPPEDKEERVVIIERFPQLVTEAGREEYAVEKNKFPHGGALNGYKLKSKAPVSIDGKQGFEFISFDYYTDSGKKSRGYYQVCLFTDTHVITISGYCRRDIDLQMAAFKSMFKTFLEK